MNGIFGRLLTRRFAQYDPDSFSWKMLRALGRRDSVESEPLWPETGTYSGGIALELLILARPIDEIEFSSLPDLLPTPVANDGKGSRGYSAGGRNNIVDIPFHTFDNWGKYLPAITRWENVTSMSAPEPQFIDESGERQTSSKFVEWIMGLPPGHVTDPAIGVTWRAQLRMLGNSVVPAAAEEAYDQCLDDWV